MNRAIEVQIEDDADEDITDAYFDNATDAGEGLSVARRRVMGILCDTGFHCFSVVRQGVEHPG
jgi:hypothetical protein